VNTSPRGRQFFFNPGPTNIPDRILRAMNRASLDFLSEEFLAIQRFCHQGVKRILKTKQNVFMYAANGHGAWEASLVNLFSPGDKILMLESGHFSLNWEEMCRDLGLPVETLVADWRLGADMQALEKRLKADAKGEIKGVLVVHNETSTGLVHPVDEVRKAMTAARHGAFLLTDTISSLGCMDFRFDEWGVDVAVSGSQKGLMLPTGLSLTGVSNKALEASGNARLARPHLLWPRGGHQAVGRGGPRGGVPAARPSCQSDQGSGQPLGRRRQERRQGLRHGLLRSGQIYRGAIQSSRPTIQLGDGGRASRRARRQRRQAGGVESIQPLPRRRARPAERPRLPHRSYGRPERAHAAWRAGDCGDDARRLQGSA
jgi:hypothetical protein